MNKTKFIKNKRTILLLVLLLVILIVIFIFIHEKNKPKVLRLDSSEKIIQKIDVNSFSKNFVKEYKVIVYNNTKSIKTISIGWKNVKNTVDSNKFLYEISCEGVQCKQMSMSQGPANDFVLFGDIYLGIYDYQTYTIKLVYKGDKKKNVYFKGNLVFKEDLPKDKKAYEQYVKSHNMRKNNIDKFVSSSG